MADYTSIDDPSAYFQCETYTGGGANSTVTFSGNSNLQPDLLWIKSRSSGYDHNIFDTNRGIAKLLEPSQTNVENTNQTWISNVSSDSFTIGVNEHNLSNTSNNFVAWAWKANGGTTSSNTVGDINSTVQVNSTAGLSIVSYTGNFTATQTVGHGLGVTPDLVIIKNRDTAVDWVVWSPLLSSGNFLRLNTNAAQSSSSRIYQSGFTTTTFGIGANNSVNKSGDDLIAYCFAEKQGYSRFADFYGNGQADGTFAYCGFRPAFVLIKNIASTEPWVIYDTKRNPHNVADLKLTPNTADSENGNSQTGGTSYNNIDILSNGFKMRTNNGATNQASTKFIFAAFAEHPFVSSSGVPTTAR